MNKIKRYDLWENDVEMMEVKYGDYVEYDAVKELIECDWIERKLLESCVEVECRLFGNGEVTVVLWLRCDVDFEFSGKTKLEALRKAEKWLSERG